MDSRREDLSGRQRIEATKFFQQNVLPALTPLVVDSADPTPFLCNLSLLGVAAIVGIDFEDLPESLP
jgi:polyphosphate kinase